MLAHLLPFLPEGEQYRLIFHAPDMREVVRLAASHVGRLGRKGGGSVGRAVDARVYAAAYAGAEVAAEARGNPVLAVSYAEALADPAAAAARLARSLGEPFDTRVRPWPSNRRCGGEQGNL